MNTFVASHKVHCATQERDRWGTGKLIKQTMKPRRFVVDPPTNNSESNETQQVNKTLCYPFPQLEKHLIELKIKLF